MKQTMGASVALLCLAGTMGVFFLSRAEAAATDAGVAAEKKADQALDRMESLERFVKQDLREARSEQKADMQELKAEIRNGNKREERRRPRPPADAGPGPVDPRRGP